MVAAVNYSNALVIYINCIGSNDSTNAINIYPMMHAKTKYISIKCLFLRELVQDKEVRLEYVNTKEQIASIFTKPLPKDVIFVSKR